MFGKQLHVVLLALAFSARALGAEELATATVLAGGAPVPYILNTASATPKFLLILFPGGSGIVNPRYEDGKIKYEMRANFLLRTREFFVDEEFATIAMDSTQSQERIQAVIDSLRRRFADAKIYLIGTSRGTLDTMRLAGYLSDKIDGEVHTSSLSSVAYFNGPSYKNRQLLVHHRKDACRHTPLASAEDSHTRFGTELITMDGGISTGDPCQPFAYHGYHGIERETANAIKQWIKQRG